jgi:hypothetical protein
VADRMAEAGAAVTAVVHRTVHTNSL